MALSQLDGTKRFILNGQGCRYIYVFLDTVKRTGRVIDIVNPPKLL